MMSEVCAFDRIDVDFDTPEESVKPVTERRSRLLVVDADESRSSALVASLELSGADFESVIAGSVRDAVALAAEQEFDCALVAEHLPDGDGVALITILRSRARLSRVPSVVLGFSDTAASAVTALRAGASDYLLHSQISGQSLSTSLTRAIREGHWNAERDRLRLEAEARRLGAERDDAARQPLPDHMVHAILTPLASIQEFVSLVLDGVAGEFTEEQGKYLAYARGSCDAIRSLVSESTLPEQASTGMPRGAAPVALAELIEAVLLRCQPDAELRGISLDWLVDTPTLTTIVDAYQLRLVLGRLVNSAVQLSGNGSAIQVVAREQRKFNAIELTIRASLGIYQQLAAAGGTELLQDDVRCFQLMQGEYLVDCEFGSDLSFSLLIPLNSK